MNERNPRFINTEKFINYCEEKNIAISRMSSFEHKVVNLNARELIEEYDNHLTHEDIYNNLNSRIKDIIKSNKPYNMNTGELFPDTIIRSQQLADELTRRILDDENISRILQLYYKSKCCGDELDE